MIRKPIDPNEEKVDDFAGEEIDEDSEEQEETNVMVLMGETKSLYFFTAKNKLRKKLYKISVNLWFEYFILLVVLISSILIAWDNPLASSDMKGFLLKIDYGITAIFTIEMVIKIIAQGFIFCGPKSYFLSIWNKMDFFIVLVSVMSYFASDVLKIFKVFRLLRTIKPLKLVSKNDGLKIALKTMLKAAPNLLQLMIILFIFFVLCGVFMVNVLKGTFHDCH